MPLPDLFVGPRKTSLKPGELLIDITIPKENLGKPLAFEKFGLRKGQALALVNAAASFWVDGKKSAFAAPRIALGAVAPTVIRAPKAEAYLEGRKISAEAMAEAGRIAATEAKPISDFRASAEYRRDLIAVLVKRALANAQARAATKEKELVA
jgi:carbon-monoxide dehydrogenase medium subunit